MEAHEMEFPRAMGRWAGVKERNGWPQIRRLASPKIGRGGQTSQAGKVQTINCSLRK